MVNKNKILEERVKKIEAEVKKRIREDIEERQKRKPTNKEVEEIYRKRVETYERNLNRTNTGLATGGPAVGGKMIKKKGNNKR
jgi:TPP-dependent pyruvate/acetoin dehydrogenase alpha subunit